MNEYGDTTFVIQGAVAWLGNECLTEKTIYSIRGLYPGAKIILSTWDKSHLESLVDAHIINPDPGAIPTNNKYFTNYNRMVVSTSSGICNAATKYVAKIRSDFWFESFFDFKRYYREHNEKILMCMSKLHYDLFPYFISDWFNFGTKEQMMQLWLGAEYDESAIGSYPRKRNFFRLPVYDCDCTDAIDHQFHSEQTLCINYLKKSSIATLNIPNSMFECGLKELIESYEILTKNFSTVSRYAVGLRSVKHRVIKENHDTLVWDLFERAHKSRSYKIYSLCYISFRYLHVLAAILKRKLIKILCHSNGH